jgi:hypothetical protein
MNTQIRNSARWSNNLKARKEHLTALLKIFDIKNGKTTSVQALTIDLIKKDMSYVESKLKGRQ